MTDTVADFIVVGGGLTGSALASRLKQGDSSLKVILLEAGPDLSHDPRTKTFGEGLTLVGSSIDWAIPTKPQPNTSGRVHTITAGKALGGGSLINYGSWSRGCSGDYNQWASVVGDDAWSFKSLLPYFRKSEAYYDSEASPTAHGFDGPIHVTSPTASDPRRKYELRDPLLSAWSQAGVDFNKDPSDGSLLGISEALESWYHGKRQSANRAFDLKDIRVMTDSLVYRIVFSQAGRDGVPRATGVLLADGRQIEARKEVVISAGALKTPQILMLSGIGPASKLAEYAIPLVHDAPEVGKNLIDHYALFQLWKLRNCSDKGLAMGSPLFVDPTLAKGLPCDWTINENVPANILTEAFEQDKRESKLPANANWDSILDARRCHTETLVIYSTLGLPGIPVDGSHVTTSMMLLIPTSRGSITISSSSPADDPVIDPNYYDAATDRATMTHGTRRVLQALLGTPAGKEYFESEVAPPGMPALTPESPDSEIDARIRDTGGPHYHSAGTAAMGRVVDTKLAVYGVRGLRIVDSSVLPVPIGAHPQATLYALAERAADIILHSLP